MISTFKKIITALLTKFAKHYIKRVNPYIIAITGNVGKTTTKDAITTLSFSTDDTVRKSPASYNSSIGIPLSILGLQNGWRNPFAWLVILIQAFFRSIKGSAVSFIVLEVGADAPGDIHSIATWLSPHIVCVTHIPEIPVHIQFFKNRKELVQEKGLLVDALRDNGLLILYGEDINDTAYFRTLGPKNKRILSVGVSPQYDVYAENIKTDTKPPSTKEKRGEGMGVSFVLAYNDKKIPLTIPQIIGESAVYPILYAGAVRQEVDKTIHGIKERIRDYTPPQSRLRLFEGIEGSVIIDDSYNSSPAALKNALNELKKWKESGWETMAVLGSMKELGEYTEEVHRLFGAEMSLFADVLIGVGEEMKWCIDEVSPESVSQYARTLEEAIEYAQKYVAGKVILIKGSQSIRTDKIVVALIKNKDDRRHVVRQGKEWKNR